ncbi:hypothetical protein EVAR_7427_1 [Eumeta japonica]|uniref:Uncharacterized protein n=1 Tax=Eumeta variegata TaxID=151549 RepID=A0A4C1V8P5_EUMVA|nr:hypothetical protein EVAR_7427_1 [Eumeta japonica]
MIPVFSRFSDDPVDATPQALYILCRAKPLPTPILRFSRYPFINLLSLKVFPWSESTVSNRLFRRVVWAFEGPAARTLFLSLLLRSWICRGSGRRQSSRPSVDHQVFPVAISERSLGNGVIDEKKREIPPIDRIRNGTGFKGKLARARTGGIKEQL